MKKFFINLIWNYFHGFNNINRFQSKDPILKSYQKKMEFILSGVFMKTKFFLKFNISK
jgi:hypothetical protein